MSGTRVLVTAALTRPWCVWQGRATVEGLMEAKFKHSGSVSRGHHCKCGHKKKASVSKTKLEIHIFYVKSDWYTFDFLVKNSEVSGLPWWRSG